MKIYFAGSITGGRQKVEDYEKIVNLLENYGPVLTKHVASKNLTSLGENRTKEDVYLRDINWLNECDIVVADITLPSTGVGYEIAYAEKLNKRIICVYEKDKNVSKLIIGNNHFEFIEYDNIENLLISLKNTLG